MKIDGDNVIIPKEAYYLMRRGLEGFASEETYMGERTGGVLQGCPRSDPPGSDELATRARILLMRVDELLGEANEKGK